MFGPVAALVIAADEAEAIGLANATRFGLGASVWTDDVERGARVAREIAAGSVFVNAMVASPTRAPVRRRQATRATAASWGRRGMREFVNVKTIWVD